MRNSLHCDPRYLILGIPVAVILFCLISLVFVPYIKTFPSNPNAFWSAGGMSNLWLFLTLPISIYIGTYIIPKYIPLILHRLKNLFTSK